LRSDRRRGRGGPGAGESGRAAGPGAGQAAVPDGGQGAAQRPPRAGPELVPVRTLLSRAGAVHLPAQAHEADGMALPGSDTLAPQAAHREAAALEVVAGEVALESLLVAGGARGGERIGVAAAAAAPAPDPEQQRG